MRLTRLVPLYAVLLLALAAVGVVNQARFGHEARLIERKVQLFEEITELRAGAAVVRGPLAVGAWARTRGMVSTPEVEQTRHVAPLAPPQIAAPPTGLEMRTVWR
ncbi:MAG: hypothetical protein WD273_10020 [Trueperaceae bacterium]